MTDPDEEHQDLIRLFERTRKDASGPTLARLATRAADVASRSERQELWRWPRRPVALGAAFAVAALLALRFAPAPSEPGRSVLATSALQIPNSIRAFESSPRRAPREGTGREPSEEEASDSADLSAEADDGEHFELARPKSDRELDAWLAATEDVSGGS